MQQVETVYQRGIIAAIDQFTLAEEELRLYVIYTYYHMKMKDLYISEQVRIFMMLTILIRNGYTFLKK